MTLSPALTRPRASGWGLHAVLTAAMALPMLILYAIGALGPMLVRELGIEAGWLGVLTSSSFGLAAVLSLWAGTFVERLGTRCALGLLFLSVALAYTLVVALPGLPGLVAAIGVGGVAQALSNPATNALIAQRVSPARKAIVVGLKQSGVQIAALFAGLILPGLASRFGWRVALGLVVPVALLLALSAAVVAPGASAGARQPLGWPRPTRALGLLMGVQGCVGMALSAFATFLPLFATRQGLPGAQAGAMLAVLGATGLLSRLVLTPWAARLRDESHLLLGLLLVAASMIALTMQGGPARPWPWWAAAAGMGLSAVATNAVAMAMLFRDPAFGKTANASGLLSSAFFAGFALGPPAFGALTATSAGFTGAWWASITVLLVGSSLAWTLSQTRRGTLP